MAGTPEALSRLEAELWKREITTTPLLSSAPFHSPIMAEAAQILEAELALRNVQPFRFPVLSGVTAQPYADERDIAKGLGDQLVRPIQWRSMLDYADSREIDAVIEIGPQSVLCALVKENGKSYQRTLVRRGGRPQACRRTARPARTGASWVLPVGG